MGGTLSELLVIVDWLLCRLAERTVVADIQMSHCQLRCDDDKCSTVCS